MSVLQNNQCQELKGTGTYSCNDYLQGKVVILVSHKRCVIGKNFIAIKKGVSKKNAILKIKGNIIPKEINSKLYQSLFVDEKSVEHIPFYN